jgi:hypothetical protein
MGIIGKNHIARKDESGAHMCRRFKTSTDLETTLSSFATIEICGLGSPSRRARQARSPRCLLKKISLLTIDLSAVAHAADAHEASFVGDFAGPAVRRTSSSQDQQRRTSRAQDQQGRISQDQQGRIWNLDNSLMPSTTLE